MNRFERWKSAAHRIHVTFQTQTAASRRYVDSANLTKAIVRVIWLSALGMVVCFIAYMPFSVILTTNQYPGSAAVFGAPILALVAQSVLIFMACSMFAVLVLAAHLDSLPGAIGQGIASLIASLGRVAGVTGTAAVAMLLADIVTVAVGYGAIGEPSESLPVTLAKVQLGGLFLVVIVVLIVESAVCISKTLDAAPSLLGWGSALLIPALVALTVTHIPVLSIERLQTNIAARWIPAVPGGGYSRADVLEMIAAQRMPQWPWWVTVLAITFGWAVAFALRMPLSRRAKLSMGRRERQRAAGSQRHAGRHHV